MQEKIEGRILRRFGTHDGSFHADEVTACALLLLFDQIDRDQIIRTRDTTLLASCDYVCDVGGIYEPSFHHFDHHQAEYQGELSSAGMVWLYLWEQGIVKEETSRFFNHSLIMGIDAHDNGRVHLEEGSCSFSQIIANFVPPIYDVPPEVQNVAFFEALDFTLGHLRRLLIRFEYMQSCRQKVAESMKPAQKVLFFEQAMPWMDAFFSMGGESHPALFVVMPSGGNWKLRGIPPTLKERMQVRLPLPREWAGLLGEELQAVSGIQGAIFCHKGQFISVWKTKEDACKALDYILNSTG